MHSRRYGVFVFGAQSLRAGVLLCAILCSAVEAQVWPTKPVRVIVPMATGGGSDIVARITASKLSETLGQQFVVDNRGGGGGLIGIGMAVKAPPDGYTLMLISGSVPATIAAHKPPYDAIGGLNGVIRVGYSPLVLVVHPAMPVKSAKDLIALVRARPGQLSFVVPGVGSLTHLAMEYLMSLTQMRMLHVPYKSTGLGMPDLLSGQVQVMMTGLLPVSPHVQTGRLRALAVSTAQRWPTQREIPALAETVPGFDVESWFAYVAPKSTPAAAISRLNAELNRILQDAEVRKLFDGQGMAVAGGTAEDADRRMRSEHDRWAKIIRDANIRVEG
jgi:tripartite-type tricarboxylate transporter receptor subunit TctC